MEKYSIMIVTGVTFCTFCFGRVTVLFSFVFRGCFICLYFNYPKSVYYSSFYLNVVKFLLPN